MRRMIDNTVSVIQLYEEDWGKPDEYGDYNLDIQLEPNKVYDISIDFPAGGSYLYFYFPSTTTTYFITRPIWYDGSDPNAKVISDEMIQIKSDSDNCVFSMTTQEQLQEGEFTFQGRISTWGPVGIVESTNV